MTTPTVKITYSDNFNLPHIPKYIVRPDGSKTNIKNLPDKALKAIGDAWAKELIAKAKKANEENGPLLPLEAEGPSDE